MEADLLTGLFKTAIEHQLFNINADIEENTPKE